jgi:SWI/SNF-related matrix-associated actin-dependent regulator 1 of chromatin subfamily A
MSVLYPYQETGARWLLDAPRRYLADKCGLGKTVQGATGARLLDVRYPLVITKAAAVENWRREWYTWGPDCGVTIISDANARLHQGRIFGDDYDLVILDEAHRFKNGSADRTIAALTVARDCERAWLLSASPSPNYDPMELWAPIRALWPELVCALGIPMDKLGKEAWREMFCRTRMTRYGPRTYGVRNGPVLRQLLDQIMLRRSVEDVYVDLPPVRPDVQLLPRDPAMEQVIRAIAERDTEDAYNAVYRRVTGEFKAPRIADVIDGELRDREYGKVVIMAYHTSVLDRFQAKLAPHGVVRLDGATGDKQAVVDRFTEDTGTRVFLGQQVAAGEAINLQVASEIVLAEPSHSPEENVQAIERLRPHLQGNRVRARIFAVAGSQDEGVIENIAAKLRNRKELGL